jgi:subtilisin family serine protease
MARSRHTAVACLALGILAACSADQPVPVAPDAASLAKGGSKGSASAAKYIVEFNGDAVPADFAARVAAIGGTIESSLDGAGLAIVSASGADFESRAERLGGVASVTPDMVLEWIDPNQRVVDLAHTGPINTHDDTYYPIQWHLDAVDAPEAWATGATGAGARVAILDGAIYAAHVDLAANVDVAASRSFVPGVAFNQDLGTFWHGTHVAGIVGAVDNNLGVLGVAPRATLIGVKVLHGGTGNFSWLMNALYYAATPLSEGGAGADVINMSLGALVEEKPKDKVDRRDTREFLKLLDRATTYAWKNGATVIASAGNSAIDFGAPEAKGYITVPADAKHVIAVSATAPEGWALGNRDYAAQSSYTNYGKKLVDLAAPGGDSRLPGNAACTVPVNNTPPTITQPCWVFDLVISTSRGTAPTGGYSFAAGTSMASPVVAGIAALIIGQNGGDMHPAQVEARLRQSALDLGKPGFDELYGHGFVNAYRAVAGEHGPVAKKD